jgi:hypothetical protein
MVFQDPRSEWIKANLIERLQRALPSISQSHFAENFVQPSTAMILLHSKAQSTMEAYMSAHVMHGSAPCQWLRALSMATRLDPCVGSQRESFPALVASNPPLSVCRSWFVAREREHAKCQQEPPCRRSLPQCLYLVSLRSSTWFCSQCLPQLPTHDSR